MRPEACANMFPFLVQTNNLFVFQNEAKGIEVVHNFQKLFIIIIVFPHRQQIAHYSEL